MSEEPRPAAEPATGGGPVGAEAAPGGGAVVAARHRDHRFPGRGRRVTVRLGEEEYAAVVLAAGRAGLTPSGFVGRAALAAAEGAALPGVSGERAALAELMSARVQVRRFGTNVNQAVAALNASGEAPEWLGQAVALAGRAVARVDEAAEALMRKSR